ncbi:Oncoprotein-induced transcript 3 protein [Mizuhopecten yessoensis]|uniref:Oncoprotein-induced transcript 3 protein n=1 Tax=Mizuhopecten yessoensis TaxID=6573 RepID=A0A210PT55_MIZYE|nr:Oncoprotein-induced transcript 3 protein [Mizuhopecten yessoensis]
MLRTFCILVTCLFFVSGQEADPCLPTTYRAIDHPWRSTSNVVTSSTAQCDSSLVVKWYRSTSGAGGTMPATRPDLNACGTVYPLWMDDELPNAGETAEIKMCIRTPFTSCQDTWNIRVKNCNTFYVYELQQAPTCPSAYCFGDKAPCPDGQTSDTGFTPCTEISVNISGINLSPNRTADLVDTTITYELGLAIAKVIEFQCNIDVTRT